MIKKFAKNKNIAKLEKLKISIKKLLKRENKMEQSAFAPIQITYENRLTYQTFHKMSALWEHAFEV